MNDFQKNVLTVALVMFSILMFIFSIMIQKTQKQHKIPPNIAPCPDYWTMDDQHRCINSKNLGTVGCSSPMDLNVNKYKGLDGKTEKCKFAKGCGVEWDGITNVGLC